MKTFTIENETNNITLHSSAKEAGEVPNSERFGTEQALLKLAADWPMSRLVEIWNGLPGVTAVSKFKDRTTGVARIWKAIQSLGEATPAELSEQQPEADATEIAAENTQAETALAELPAAGNEGAQEPAVTPDVAPQSPDAAPEGMPAENDATPPVETSKPATKKSREGSKTETVVTMMKQPGGTTLKAIMEATNWQAHSVRGFISGTLTKKMKLTVISSKGEGGERTYTITT